jgi:small subunit ribosomal protein S9
LIEDEKQQPQDETSEGSGAEAAGPVAEDGSSSSRDDAAGEEPSSTPPADATPEASDDAPEVDAGTVEEPEAEAAQDETPAEESAAEETAEQESPKPKAEKKDVIPGADLEPIAVEPEERPRSAEEQARLEAEEEERAKREAELEGEAEEPSPASRAPQKMEGDARFLATGKRKTSIARVTLLPGSGKIEINKRELEEFFPRPLHQTMARQPLTITGYEGSVDVRVRVHGGGISGQAGAVRHGIARALTEVDPELRGELKRRGFLTRDARAKERRKAGLKKARKRPQFSKR